MWRVLRGGLERLAQKAPLTFEIIREALVSLPDSVAGKRDRALLLLGYTLMTRRSELVALNVEDFQSHEDGAATVTFERLKTGEQSTNFLSREVMAILSEWLAVAHIDKGAVFRRLDHASQGKRGRMTGQSVGVAFKRIARFLELPELDPDLGVLSARARSHRSRPRPVGDAHDVDGVCRHPELRSRRCAVRRRVPHPQDSVS